MSLNSSAFLQTHGGLTLNRWKRGKKNGKFGWTFVVMSLFAWHGNGAGVKG